MTHSNIGGQVVIDGQFVSQRIEQIVLAIKDYDPDLCVGWIPPHERNEGQAAFKVSYEPPGQPPYILFHVKTEEEFDERVLRRIIQNDQRVTGQVGWNEFRAFEIAEALVEKQKYLDELEEAEDIARHLIKTPLNTYRVNKDLVVKEGIPFNAQRLEGPKHMTQVPPSKRGLRGKK